MMFHLANVEFNEILGRTITKHRKAQRYSQEKLAEGTGMHPTAISHIETGKHSPSITTLRKICDFLNIKLSTLLEETEAQEKTPDKP